MKNTKRILFYLCSVILITLLSTGISNSQQTAGQLFEKALYAEEIEGDLADAVRIYQQILDDSPDNRSVSAKALLHIGMCYEKLGSEQARRAYRQLISTYSEQEQEVAVARDRISRLDASDAELIAIAEEHLKKGNDLFKRWEYESAIKEYENAVSSGPNTELALNARYCIGQSWYRAGKYDKALATFTKLIEENPQSNIAPVTELMVAQVKNAMEIDKSPTIENYSIDVNEIIDPLTGIIFRKIKSFTGKNDVFDWGPSSLSPNGKFLLSGSTVIPMDGSDPFKFVEMQINDPNWSPDGEKVAFTKDTSLYVIPVSPETGQATGSVKNLSNKGHIYGFNWSPDSKLIYYSILDYQNKNYPEIWSMSLSDGSTKPIAGDSTMGVNPSCSPDGKTIAFRDMLTIYLCPSTGGVAESFIKKDKSYNPGWTPDGKWLYWDDTRYSNSRMTFIRLYDELEFKLNLPEKIGSHFTFSNDGDKLLFFHPSHELFWGMKVASASGGPAYEPVPHFPAYDAWWAEDSKMIIVQDDPDLILVPISGGASYRMDLDINMQGKQCHYDISPGNNYISFEIINENDRGDLYVAPVSIEDASIIGPPQKVIKNWTYIGGYNTNLSWSSDGSRLAFIHEGNIWIYKCDDNSLKQLTDTPLLKRWVGWSPDGTKICHQESNDKPGSGVSRIISSHDGKSIKIIKDVLVMPYGWAPDSKSIVYDLDGKIVNHNIQTGEIRTIINPKSTQLSWIASFSWSPDGKYLILDTRKKSDPDKYFLYKIPAQGGALTELATGDSDAFKYNIRWSPDGKWFCYSYMKLEKVRPESTLWEADYDDIMEKLVK